ncbi:hypothetical protein N7463_008492 [Penicillium fimorum]|uniref:Uncharacterized protein n=1 Tax=Penicillium fimorum TaxID=1882269 RepID=A0A9W9XQ06_9EURO|nr:hypothetical protein N7463_008492 [Penicillium fimorum]
MKVHIARAPHSDTLREWADGASPKRPEQEGFITQLNRSPRLFAHQCCCQRSLPTCSPDDPNEPNEPLD